MRLICFLTGSHAWGDPVRVNRQINPVLDDYAIFEAVCTRCGRSIKGDWDWMERNGAWKHWRSRDVSGWTVLKAVIREWWRR